MKLEELVKKAKYIQFPYLNQEYKLIYEERHPIKLPILRNQEVLYTGMPKSNEHHYTTKYTYDYVLPVLNGLFNFSYSRSDFNLVNVKNGNWDLSYLKPKVKENYSVLCFDTSEKFFGDYTILIDPIFFKEPLYRELYIFPHSCSRIINHSSRSDRKLMISGDSQMIPSIAPLAHYFREVWYFDNRTGWIRDKETKQYMFCENKFRSFSDKYSTIEFTDVLIECYCRKLDWYEYWNLQ